MYTKFYYHITVSLISDFPTIKCYINPHVKNMRLLTSLLRVKCSIMISNRENIATCVMRANVNF